MGALCVVSVGLARVGTRFGQVVVCSRRAPSFRSQVKCGSQVATGTQILSQSLTQDAWGLTHDVIRIAPWMGQQVSFGMTESCLFVTSGIQMMAPSTQFKL